MADVGIIGATAYSSLELIRILLRHPDANVVYLGVRREGNPAISSIFPSLSGMLDLECAGLAPDDMPRKADVIFSTLPPTVSMQFIPPFVEAGVPVVDFSADYRFQDRAVYEESYQAEHTDEGNLTGAVYGLPEFYREDVKNAKLVANPGCYPTSALIGLVPLAKRGLIALDSIIVDSKSGVSGAGRKLQETTQYCECNESIAAYKVGVHRHEPEIAVVLSDLAGAPASPLFVPHLTPMDRGILSTIYAQTTEDLLQSDAQRMFEEAYNAEPFVRVRGPEDLPKTKDVAYTNFCDVAVRVARGRVVVVACIDNLVKGAAGQAVQNMNVMLGIDETAGLLVV